MLLPLSQSDIETQLAKITDDFMREIGNRLSPVPETANILACVSDPTLQKIFALMMKYRDIAAGNGSAIEKALASAKVQILDGQFLLGILKENPIIGTKKIFMGRDWVVAEVTQTDDVCFIIEDTREQGDGLLWN